MSSEFLARAVRGFFGIVVALALLTFFVMSVDAQHSSCVCYYSSPCVLDGDGVAWRYLQCTGACYAYSGWDRVFACYGDAEIIKKLEERAKTPLQAYP